MSSIPQMFADSVSAILSNIHTALPGIIKSYDATTNKATIQPALNKAYVTGSMPMPLLENVPIMFPGGKDFNITYPINEGDYVLLIFIERSIDLWLSVGGQVTPDDPRKFDLSDAVAIPGLQPFTGDFSERNNTDFSINYAGSSITIKSNGDIIINTVNKVGIGNSTAEVLDVLSRVINILQTSITEAVGQPIQQTPLPPTGDTYTSLKLLIDNLKATIT